MCGIYCYSGDTSRPLFDAVIGLQKLEYRGYDSWGVGWRDTAGQLSTVKRVGSVADVEQDLDRSFSETTKQCIAHTRWATHGSVSEDNAHPRVSYDQAVMVVHNGIVENYRDLAEELQSAGVIPKAATMESDTQVLVDYCSYLCSKHDEHSLLELGQLLSSNISGRNAAIFLLPKTGQLLAVSTGAPLILARTSSQNAELVISSDVVALPNSISEVWFMQPGDAVVLENGRLIDMTSAPDWQPFDGASIQVEKSEYDTYLEQEIRQQPQVLRTLAALPLSEEQTRFASEVEGSNQFFFVGCGTSYHAALLAEYICRRSGIAATACVGSAFSQYQELVKAGDTVILFSQSGETADIVSNIDWLRQHQVKIIAITNTPTSTLARESDTVIELKAGIERSVLATKSFMAQLVRVMQLCGEFVTNTTDRHRVSALFKTDLNQLADKIEGLVQDAAFLKGIADVSKRLAQAQSVFILGKAATVSIAQEAALKIKEACYIHAEAFESGELKHGVLALIEEGSLVMVFPELGESRDSVLHAAAEVRARGGTIIGIDTKSAPEYDLHISLADLSSTKISRQQQFWQQLSGQVVCLQMIALYTATELGINSDRPRNLAKSVTVA